MCKRIDSQRHGVLELVVYTSADRFDHCYNFLDCLIHPSHKADSQDRYLVRKAKEASKTDIGDIILIKAESGLEANGEFSSGQNQKC